MPPCSIMYSSSPISRGKSAGADGEKGNVQTPNAILGRGRHGMAAVLVERAQTSVHAAIAGQKDKLLVKSRVRYGWVRQRWSEEWMQRRRMVVTPDADVQVVRCSAEKKVRCANPSRRCRTLTRQAAAHGNRG